MADRTTKRPNRSKKPKTATAAKASRKSPRQRAAAVIKLAAKHQRELRRITKGAVDTDTILLRPDLDLGKFLTAIASLAATLPSDLSAGKWKLPNGGMWV